MALVLGNFVRTHIVAVESEKRLAQRIDLNSLGYAFGVLILCNVFQFIAIAILAASPSPRTGSR